MRKRIVWWKVQATPMYDGTPNDDATSTYYMLAEHSETAKQETIEAMMDKLIALDEYGPHDVRIDYVRKVKSPPQGALYQMVSSSEL